MLTINTLTRFGIAVLSVALLSSCGLLWRSIFRECKPNSMMVPDGAIHGTYSGWLEDHPVENEQTRLQLILAAEFVDEDSYTLQGDFIVGDDEALDFHATVTGGCGSEYQQGEPNVEPQMQALPGEQLEGQVTRNGEQVWRIRRHGTDSFQFDPDGFWGYADNFDLNEGFVFRVTRE